MLLLCCQTEFNDFRSEILMCIFFCQISLKGSLALVLWGSSRDPRIMVEIDPFLLLCSCPDSTFHSNLNCRLETIKHMVQTDPQIYARGREKQSVSHFSVREM